MSISRAKASRRPSRSRDIGKPLLDAGAAQRVVALGQRADDRALVREELVERADRHAGALGHLAHPHGIAAAFGDQRRGRRQHALDALAAALLRRQLAPSRPRAAASRANCCEPVHAFIPGNLPRIAA